MKLIEKNDTRTVYSSNVEGMEFSFQRITDSGMVLTLVKGNKRVDILFEDEEIDSRAVLFTISDNETQTHNHYNLTFDCTLPYDFTDEELEEINEFNMKIKNEM
jgi:hypothetical protein